MTAPIALETYLDITFSEDKSVAYLQFSKRSEDFEVTEEELQLF